MNPARRMLVAVAALPLLLGPAACGHDPAPVDIGDTVTIVGQQFTEADILSRLYQLLLDKDGFRTRIEKLGARDLYLGPLEKNDVQVAVDYLTALTETLNRTTNGDSATPVSSPDVGATLAQLTTLGREHGLTPLAPTPAQNGSAFAVTREFAATHDVATLGDLGRLGRPIALAASADCAERPDCALGLRSVYGIRLTKVEPLGLGSSDTVDALTNGSVQLGQVTTTDGTLVRRGLVVLRDDRRWQHAENVVPVVNTNWLEDNPKARAALERLSGVLTTEDLTALNAEVDLEGRPPGTVAEDYLRAKGLL